MSNEPFTSMTDEDLADIGMYRCECGTPVVVMGGPDTRHCELDPEWPEAAR